MGNDFCFVVTAHGDEDLNKILEVLTNKGYERLAKWGLCFKRDGLIQIILECRFLFFRFGRICVNRRDNDTEDTTVRPVQWELLFPNSQPGDASKIRTAIEQIGLDVSGISLVTK